MNPACAWVAASSLDVWSAHRQPRLALAVAASVVLHAVLLTRPFDWASRPFAHPRLQASLRFKAPEAALLEATTPSAVSGERTPPARSMSARQPIVRARPPSAEQAPAAEVVVPRVVQPSGQDLAVSAKADIGRVMRDMARQERSLDPTRGHMPAPQVPAVPRDAIAIALEKRFGRPLPFLEESSWTALEGGMVWRIKTEHGAICLMEMPPNAMMSAPGQGAGKTLMVPLPCD